jgi:two-component system, NarL family, nitrate/nitrite response regulator NarL
MATNRTFPLIDVEADANIEVDTQSAETRLAEARAKLVIATRHEITAAGIETVLHAAGHCVAARCSCEAELVRFLDAYRPDIIILAESIVGREATRTVSRLRTRNRSVSIILLLETREAITAADLLDLHVQGVLLSGACAASFVDCVRSVHLGRKWIDPDLLCQLAIAERYSEITSSLTSREADVAHLTSKGLHNKQIARELRLSEATVKMHLHHIYEKLQLSGRTQLALSMASVGARKVSVT